MKRSGSKAHHARKAALATEAHWDRKAEDSQDDDLQPVMVEDPWVNRCIERAQQPIVRDAITSVVNALGAQAESVLDLGCGIGRWIPILAPNFRHYHGVEISESMLQIARRRFPDRHFSKLQKMVLPADDQSVDFALSIAVLHHNSYVNQNALLRELHRILRPGGELLILESNHPRTESGISVFYPRPSEDWVDTIEEHGFLLLKKTGTTYHFLTDIVSRLLRSDKWLRSPPGRASLWLDSYVTPAIAQYLPERLQTRLAMRFRRIN